MRTALTDDQFSEALATFRHSAFRLETKSAYTVVGERSMYAKFLAEQPLDVGPEDRYYTEALASMERRTKAGASWRRVRITDDPPTEYQQFLQWSDKLNRAAGDDIYYLGRTAALAAGLPARTSDPDWWLLDDERLLILTHDKGGRRINTTLTTDPDEVQQARLVRDLAVRTARKETE